VSLAFRLPNQPVVLNYRFRSADEASRVPRRDIALVQCANCGLVFNSEFDPNAIPYDERYENRQCFSPAFQQHLDALAQSLIARHNLRGGRILEIGCGKGDFLRLICAAAPAQGAGFDTTYEGPLREANVEFHRQYATPANVNGSFGALICRHVIEHVPNIGAFLSELHSLARAAGDPVVVLETPSFEWIVRQGCFWDVFGEHCNYFSMPTLAFLAETAGFRVLRHSLVFGEQYQLLELKVAATGLPSSTAPGIRESYSLDLFSREVTNTGRKLEERLLAAGADEGWAVWGAGAKGVALVNQITMRPPDFVVDSNPAKQGGVIPGTSIPVVSPEDARVPAVPVILVVNPNYLDEIKGHLAARGFRHTLLSL
jgi:SAM-dependent methyltransferase